VPFDAAAWNGSTPVLLVAMPDAGWAAMSNARVEESSLVARVPLLSHAMVGVRTETVDASVQKAPGEQAQKSSLLVSATMTVDATTAPPLPPAGANGVTTVTQPTNLVLRTNYTRAPRCSGGLLQIYATFVRQGTFGSTQVNLASVVTGISGSYLVSQQLGASQNGRWVFYALHHCGGYQVTGSVLETGPSITVNVQPTAAPTITQSPQNVSVTEGSVATFSVAANGTGLAYQWQRSNNGGTSYANVTGATATSTSLTTALADNGSLWRVVVSNAGGSATSAPARLSVAQRIVAPAVTSNPANQSVTEGQTASFTVGVSGTPAPTIQWQIRAAANTNPDLGWGDIAGATAATYTTGATTLAQTGSQYRAVLRNSGGSAVSTAATLTVNQRLVAPTITTQPVSQTVQSGQYGAFSVAAAGTSPLSYQWFKNGVAITGATASSVLVLADAANVGGSDQITVRVSNSVGNVTSAVATMTIAAAPAGTLIKAIEGGLLTAGTDTGPSLLIPPGALAGDTTVTFSVQSSTAANLPADIVPLGEVLNIGPAGLTFSAGKTATLSLPVPADVPEGKVLALVELQAATGAQKTSATSTVSKGSVTMMAPGDPIKVLCAQAANQTGGRLDTVISTTKRFVAAAVSESSCAGDLPAPAQGAVPSDTQSPCTNRDFVPASQGNAASLLSRHVHCQRDSRVLQLGGPTGYHGTYELRWKIGSDGVSTGLSKTYRVRLSLLAVNPEPGNPLPALKVRPYFSCFSPRYPLGACTVRPLGAVDPILSANGEVEVKVAVDFSWDGGSGTWTEFSFGDVELAYAYPGEDVTQRARVISLSQPPQIRCDKGLASVNTSGCVYEQSPAVYVLDGSEGSAVFEAAQHIAEAQAAGSPGAWLTADGNRGAGLQRAKSEVVQDENRKRACRLGDALIKTRLPLNQSPKCAAGTQTCTCDEYPFASTWNGARFDPDRTSVKEINAAHNSGAGGGRLSSNFYLRERVLDFTLYPEQVQPYDPSAESNRGGDSFWVHIK
jgi:hypothetical protein